MLTAPLPPAVKSATPPEPRRIEFRHIWTGERLDVVYKTGDAYDLAAMGKIDWFLRDWRCQKSTRMDPALIDLVYDIYHEVGAKGPIRVLSGYRSEGLNASMLRSGRVVDPNSQHMQGKAVDVAFSGAPLARLKAAAAARHSGGVGYYPSSRPAFVHIDTGRARDWEEQAGGRRGGRLRLDCSLTMAEALREVTLARALAALPAGAASTKDETIAASTKDETIAVSAKDETAAPIIVVADGGAVIKKEEARAETPHRSGKRRARLRRAHMRSAPAPCHKSKGGLSRCAKQHKQKKKKRR
jgi:uncharacterized protein YcbK (DUF882 family)